MKVTNEDSSDQSDNEDDGNENSDQLAASDGEEMKENQHPLKKRFKDIGGGVVGIPALGPIAKKFNGR